MPDKWPFIDGGQKSSKKMDFLAIFLKKSKIDPPNLLKSQWRSASIKKVTKGLLIFSPIHGRMQKIRKSYWIVFENMHGGPGPVIYGTTTRTGQGPYPALPDNECKNSDHLVAGVAPLGKWWNWVRCLPLTVVSADWFVVADWSLVAMSNKTFWQKVTKTRQ